MSTQGIPIFYIAIKVWLTKLFKSEVWRILWHSFFETAPKFRPISSWNAFKLMTTYSFLLLIKHLSFKYKNVTEFGICLKICKIKINQPWGSQKTVNPFYAKGVLVNLWFLAGTPKTRHWTFWKTISTLMVWNAHMP